MHSTAASRFPPFCRWVDAGGSVVSESDFAQQLMKTSSSFFPTRTNIPSQPAPTDRTFNLIRPHPAPHPPSRTPPLHRNSNIFSDATTQNMRVSIDQATLRPVGGMDIFKRGENGFRERPNEGRKLSKRSKDSTQRFISPTGGLGRPKKDRHSSSDREVPVYSAMPGISELQAEQKQPSQEEIYKSQKPYAPTTATKSHLSEAKQTVRQRPSSSRPCTSKKENWEQVRDEWAAQQRKNYQDKMALLNEINFNRPLIERYGDRYFEHILRNRYEEDFQPPVFVYQISGQFSDSKAIDRIRKNGPAVREKTLMVVRGRKLTQQPNN